MRSSKSRSRNKSNRQRSIGNIINRVFDSSGPEGKVRGTPQQIIDKYLALARDAQLGNDRVAEQNFLQHAEHYTRLLGEAQREMAREQEERQRTFQQNGNRDRQDRFERDGNEQRFDDTVSVDVASSGLSAADSLSVTDEVAEFEPTPMPEALSADEDTSGLVETPEMRAEARPVPPVEAAPVAAAPKAVEPPVVEPADPANAEAAERKPRRRSPRRPAAPKPEAEAKSADVKASND